MAIVKQEYCPLEDELRSLVLQTFTSSTDAVITIDEEDETLDLKKNKKRNNLDSNSLVPSTNAVIIIDDDDEEEETLELKKNKKRNLDSKSLVPSTNAVIFIDEEETLESKEKKPRLASRWDDVDAFNELSFVVKGLPKSKDDAASIVDSLFSLTNLPKTKPKEGYTDSVLGGNKKIQDPLGYGHVSVEDSGVSVEDPCLGHYVSDIISPIDSCFPSSSSTRLLETEANTNKDDERSLSSSTHHGDNVIDLREGEIVRESTNTSNKSNNVHVSLEELGVSVEDLKSVSWEAFDPTWEIRSETMDPWLGGYIQDMFSDH